MSLCIVRRREISFGHHCDRNGIAKGEHYGCARSRRKIEVARLFINCDIDNSRRCDTERRFGSTGDGDNWDIEAKNRRKNRKQLIGFAAIRERHHDIVGRHDPEVTMQCFSRDGETGRACPVLDRVLANLRPTAPDFPMPETTTLPSQPTRRSIAAASAVSSKRSWATESASASSTSTRRAAAIERLLSVTIPEFYLNWCLACKRAARHRCAFVLRHAR